MIATELMAEAARLGITFRVQADRLQFHPPSAMTPDLANRLREHKAEVMALLKPEDGGVGPVIDTAWRMGLDKLEGDPLFPPDIMEALRTAEVRWEPQGGPDWVGLTDEELGLECIGHDELSPCPCCGSLELWQTLAGSWRCQKCDPPVVATDLRSAVERLRRKFSKFEPSNN